MLVMSEPPLLFRPEGLRDVLIHLRTEAHLSQRALSKWSGVSNTAISGLESGTAPAPHPSMLLNLARGLATSGLGAVDEERAEAAYHTLMRAAGYVPEPEPAPATDDALLRRLIERRIGTDNAPLVESILDRIRDRPAVDQQTVLSVVETLLRSMPPHTAR